MYLMALCVACKRKPAEISSSSSTGKTSIPTEPTVAAEISGVVKFEGTTPRPVPIDMSADPGCRGVNSSESLVVNDGKLQNVFVHVKGSFAFSPPSSPVVVEQRGCRYVPHIVAAAISQPIEFRNTDQTVHNIHGMPKANDAWNVSQMVQARPMTRSFSRAETMIRVKCNQHPWMNMYVNVSDSPFFAVTDAQGHFALSGIPPGTYDLVFVHETLGQQLRSVTFGAQEHKTIDLSFTR